MPILICRVRTAIALAMPSGSDNTDRCGSPCNSASHIASSPVFGGVDLRQRLIKGVRLAAAR